MALEKSIPSAYGVDALYWRISRAEAYYTERCVDVYLYGYASQAARASGASPLSLAGPIRFSFDAIGGPDFTVAGIYAAIKALAEAEAPENPVAVLKGAVDC